MNIKQLLHLLFAFLLVVTLTAFKQAKGCGKGADTPYGPPRPATEVKTSEFLLKKLKKQETDIGSLQSFTAKARLFTENESMTLNANATVIWIRDSIIWLNAKKFGIEAMRALITQDSVFILNRLEKTCTAESLESLRARFNLPEGNIFTQVQNTLLGQGIFPQGTTLKCDINEEQHRILGENNQFTAEYRIEDGSFLLKNELFLQKKDNAAIALKFDRHTKIKESPVPFSFSRIVETFSTDTGRQKVEVELDDVQFNNTPTYKFDIPGHYTRQ